MGLAEYQRKRNFHRTAEPAKGGTAGKRIFVVQLHHASHRHFDFRLEFNGVLKSWAIPKGPSFDPQVKRLAIEVEDHPLAYAAFQGHIPKGNYGAGHVDLFDHGIWEPLGSAQAGFQKGDLKFVLHGDVLRGSWALIRTRPQGGKPAWLLIKHTDEFASHRDANDFVDPAKDTPISLAQRRRVWRKTNAVPHAAKDARVPAYGNDAGPIERLRNIAFEPQLCRAQVVPPSGQDWLHEIKWDGFRLLTTIVDGKVRLWSRNAIEWTQKIPDLVDAVATLGLEAAQLDGEMIVINNGRADFNALQARLSKPNNAPLIYILFDVPHLQGRSLRELPIEARKSRLAQLLASHPHPLLRYSEHQIGEGAALFTQAASEGLEGIVSKRVGSSYSGSRNGDWIKVKSRSADEFVVVGYTEPKGARNGIGALLLAQFRNKRLTYVGRVGTGFDDAQLSALRKLLQPSVIAVPPGDIDLMEGKDRRLAVWVKPEFVVEVFFQGVGSQGLLRHTAFKTLRPDKSVKDVSAMVSKKPTLATREKRAAPASRTRTKQMPMVSAARRVVITHADREVIPRSGITKRDVAAYYLAVADWMMKDIAGRPLSVVRCPEGIAKACFFQKHWMRGWGKHVLGVSVEGDAKKYLCVRDATGLLELVQMNVLEFHPWGALSSDPDHADRLVFDLDPHSTVSWPKVIAAARNIRKQLKSIGLESFVRTSGGKGLHVVVPLNPPAPWAMVKPFAKAVAEAMAHLLPAEFVSKPGEKNRVGKIFIDWLRNGRGSTSVSSFSLRARPGAGVAMPLAWRELGGIQSGDAYTIKNAVRHIQSWKRHPWLGLDSMKQALPPL